MITVDLYCRVSTLEQAREGFSLGEQESRLRDYAKAHGWMINACYTDGGYSGAKMDRPGLQRVIEDCVSSAIKKVVVYKLDRLSRSQKDAMYLIEDVFIKNSVDFVSMSESFDTSTPFGMAMVGILSVFAQLEREQIKERMTMGMIASVKEGHWHGGSYAPIGYKYLPKINGGPGKLEVDPVGAQAVRDIFELFLAGKSYNGIYKTLGKKYPELLSTGGSAHIKTILQTRTYIGEVSYGGVYYPGNHEPIIDRETFDRAQAAIAAYQEDLSGLNLPKPYQTGHLLTGLLWCGNCGARWCFWQNTYTAKGGARVKYPSYTCYSRRSHKSNMYRGECHGRSYKADELEAIIWDSVESLRFEDLKPTEGAAYAAELASCEERLRSVDNQLSKLVDLYSVGGIPIEAVQAKSEQLSRDRELIGSRAAALRSKMAEYSGEAFADALRRVADVRASGTLEEQRALLQLLISRIIIEPDRTIKIEWRI